MSPHATPREQIERRLAKYTIVTCRNQKVRVMFKPRQRFNKESNNNNLTGSFWYTLSGLSLVLGCHRQTILKHVPDMKRNLRLTKMLSEYKQGTRYEWVSCISSKGLRAVLRSMRRSAIESRATKEVWQQLLVSLPGLTKA